MHLPSDLLIIDGACATPRAERQARAEARAEEGIHRHLRGGLLATASHYRAAIALLRAVSDP
jgi:hypothetical protein